MNGEEEHGWLDLLIKKSTSLQLLQEALCRGTKSKDKVSSRGPDNAKRITYSLCVHRVNSDIK